LLSVFIKLLSYKRAHPWQLIKPLYIAGHHRPNENICVVYMCRVPALTVCLVLIALTLISATAQLSVLPAELLRLINASQVFRNGQYVIVKAPPLFGSATVTVPNGSVFSDANVSSGPSAVLDLSAYASKTAFKVLPGGDILHFELDGLATAMEYGAMLAKRGSCARLKDAKGRIVAYM
jgi:hypothetical protein